VLFIDLDRFKVINDSEGHAVGDVVLQQVAERFRQRLLPGETLGRFGGDEFMVVCSGLRSEREATAAADRFAGELSEPLVLSDGSELFVTASIGIAYSTDASVPAESLIRNADVAMYRAKDQGRDQRVAFQENLDQRAVEQLTLERALRAAIETRQFELHYQPVVQLSDGSMTQVEALVRWNRPGHGLVLPASFVPIAEETGLIVPIGWWVLGEAVGQAAIWPALPNGSQIEVAVNLSARQLADAELVEVVSDALEQTGLDPARLCFEVTESALVHDVEHAVASLNRLKGLGVRIAIDDFGTGYATLDYVRHFSMADYLKIDRAFIEGVDRPGSQEAAIVSAAVALAKSLGFTVVAEGVETLPQMEALRDLECELAQGYLFSRPVPLDEAVVLLSASDGLVASD
jgi:diguanylate cyclase (GGDEF)-like protein